MGREKNGSGTVGWDSEKRVWRGRISLGDGARPWIDAPANLPHNARGEQRAREYVRERAQIAKDEGLTGADFGLVPRKPRSAPPPDASESCDDYFDRLMKAAREAGQTDVEKKRSRWKKWISPVIGPRPIASITPDDVEDVRDALDRAIEKWKRDGGATASKIGKAISGKTAMNAWSALTSTFRAATTGKRRELRVLAGKPNPCAGIEPPGDESSRAVRRKTFLFPKEAAALLAKKDVPIAWREVYAIALYAYLRPGELRVLTWADVDLDARVIHVTKAWDYEDQRIKPPKTRNGVRRVPIEPALVPLLARMKKDAGDDAADKLVVPTLSTHGEDHLAQLFRKHLTKAKLARVELHRSTATHVQANFRSCRDSGITWLAISGLGVDKIQRRAGHDDVNTTMGYVKVAEDLTGELGAPFGPLPASLEEGSETSIVWESSGPIQVDETFVPEEGVEPPT